MAIPSTGAVSFGDIQTEFGGSNPIGLSEYYAGGAYVPAGTTGTNGAVPSSGAICVNVFHGTSKPPPASQQAFTTAGTYSWVAPTGVTSVSVVAVGASTYSPGSGYGGGGAGLGYKNNYSVTPGNSYTVVVGAINSSTVNMTSYFVNTCTVAGRGPSISAGVRYTCGGTYVGDGGGNGGNALSAAAGGAAGYSGNGGRGCGNATVGAGSGGGGGGSGTSRTAYTGGGGGGGVGILGQGSNGARGAGSGGSPGTTATTQGGFGGSGGANGGSASVYINCGNGACPPFSGSAVGGDYGGGGGRNNCFGSITVGGGKGAVRIIWPGNTRTFPSTCTGDK